MLKGPVLNLAGVYGPATGDTRPVLAVNPDAREADIRHVDKPERMAAALGTDGETSENPTMIACSLEYPYTRFVARSQSGACRLGPFPSGIHPGAGVFDVPIGPA